VWKLTLVLQKVTGPDNCELQTYLSQINDPVSFLMTVTRKDNNIEIEFPDDSSAFKGTVNGQDFNAARAVVGAGFGHCQDGTALPFNGASDTVSGTISADGNHLVAQELYSETSDSGTLQATYGWTADLSTPPSTTVVP
jgi:hypothetical protein